MVSGDFGSKGADGMLAAEYHSFGWSSSRRNCIQKVSGNCVVDAGSSLMVIVAMKLGRSKRSEEAFRGWPPVATRRRAGICQSG